MSHYKPYPAYKNSGSEWLGAVPEHWEVKRLQYLCSNIKAGPFGSALTKDMYEREGFRVYGQEQVIPGDFSIGDYYIGAERYSELRQYEVHAGDILISCVGTYGKIAVAPNGIEPGIINPRLIRVRVNDIVTSGYLTAVMRSSVVFEQFSHQSRGGTMDVINIGVLSGIVISVPPKSEQAAVLYFLERETGRIDGLIEKKARFIELLREKRQALIIHAVTKGLDPNVKMKDSGVEWLGEVPEHWEALPLRRVVTAVKTGGTPSEEQPTPDADGLAWYTPGDFRDSLVLTFSEKCVSALAVSTGEAKVYPAGSVLVVSIGATLGKVGYIVEPASANQQINAVIPSSRVNGYFLAYSLSVKTEAMWFLANAATIGIMNQEKTKEIWLAVPSPSEQKAITEYLDKGTGRLDSLIGKTERSIALLKERRSVLITAAVTGQIDLREVV